MPPCKPGKCPSGYVCNRKTRICTSNTHKNKKVISVSKSRTMKYSKKPPTMKSMIKQILTRIAAKENANKGDYEYICNVEFDSNVTEFEGLSNDNRIVIQCKADEVDKGILIAILQALYSKNYWQFDKDDIDEWIDNVDDFDDYNKHKQDDIIKRMKKYDADIWYDMLKSGISAEFETYNEVPKPLDQYYPKSKKGQEIYTIADMIKLCK